MNLGVVTAVLAVVATAQTLAIWRMTSAVRAVARVNDRLSRFAEALALLTDTTEAGLANVASELERTGGRRAARSTRSTSKRITTAARRGRSLEEIAALESMSESEVRLHLHMQGDEVANGAVNGALRV